jgi:serine/threonine-protein kinase
VIIYDYDETDKNESYIVMELLNGQTLSSELKQLKVLRLERVMEIIQPVCSALGLAHQKGILHRDLKPGNIFLHHLEDGTEVVKLIDFGIGKLLNDGNMPLTQQGFVVGTPEYLSPERYSGKDIDERSDIYSLGVLVYRMLTGRVPFTGKTAQEILQKHLKEPPIAPRKYNQHLSTEVEEVVLRALSKDPKERPETTAKFAYELMAARISSGDTLQNMPILQQP